MIIMAFGAEVLNNLVSGPSGKASESLFRVLLRTGPIGRRPKMSKSVKASRNIQLPKRHDRVKMPGYQLAAILHVVDIRVLLQIDF